MIGDTVFKLDGEACKETRELFENSRNMLATITELMKIYAETHRRAWRAISEIAGDKMDTEKRVYNYTPATGEIRDAGPRYREEE